MHPKEMLRIVRYIRNSWYPARLTMRKTISGWIASLTDRSTSTVNLNDTRGWSRTILLSLSYRGQKFTPPETSHYLKYRHKQHKIESKLTLKAASKTGSYLKMICQTYNSAYGRCISNFCAVDDKWNVVNEAALLTGLDLVIAHLFQEVK
jgi:hypothetical protein